VFNFIIALLAFLFLIALFLRFFTNLSKIAQRKIIFIVVSIMILVSLYEFLIVSKEHEDFTLINSFYQNKSLICHGVEINSTNFNFVTGTMTFVAKKENSQYKNIIFKLSECKAKE